MATFKPALSQSREVVGPKSPIDSLLTSPFYNALEQYSLQYPWRGGRQSESTDPSRRDSGVLEEENGLDVDEQDEGNDAITVAHFNFRSPDVLKHLSSPTVDKPVMLPVNSKGEFIAYDRADKPPRGPNKHDSVEMEEMNRMLDSVNANREINVQSA